MTIYVNRLAAEPGLYVSGVWGQYANDRMIEVAENFEMSFDDDDDPRFWRRAAEAETSEDSAIVRNAVGIGSHIARPEECWERHYWAAEKVEELLNEATTGGYWTWEDGELFLIDDRARFCNSCGKHGTYDDLCFIGEECPDEDCDGTIEEYVAEQWTPHEIALGLDN